jgi:hypothetical protein
LKRREESQHFERNPSSGLVEIMMGEVGETILMISIETARVVGRAFRR